MALSKDDKEYFELLMRGMKAEFISSSDILNNKVDGINQRLDKINGRINKHDEMIYSSIQERKIKEQSVEDEIKRIDNDVKIAASNHITTCPNIKDIQDLKNEKLSNSTIKKFIIISLSSSVAIVTIVLSLLKIFGVVI